jgi:hypothetical protein
MSAVSSLTISLGLFYLLAAVAASALLRTSSAPFAFKVAGPTVLVFLACVTYRSLPDAFGYPVQTAFSSLPQQAELIAFVPHDEDKRVDLWLKADASEPRVYSVELTDGLKRTLREAQQAQAQGQRTMLVKGGKPGGRPGFIDIYGGNAPYELLPAAFQLPKKETGE